MSAGWLCSSIHTADQYLYAVLNMKCPNWDQWNVISCFWYEWSRIWNSDWICPSPNGHKCSNGGGGGDLPPVCIYCLCERNLSLVVSTLYVSYTPEWYMGCNKWTVLNSIYTTDLDESDLVTHYLIVFETSSTGSLSKASKSLIYCTIGDWESFVICRGLPSKWVLFFAFLRKLICLFLTKACTEDMSSSTYIRWLGVWVLTPSKSLTDDIYWVWTAVLSLTMHVSQQYKMMALEGVLCHTTVFTTNDASWFFAKKGLNILILHWLGGCMVLPGMVKVLYFVQIAFYHGANHQTCTIYSLWH